jgi:toxin ParE1/3/4
VTARVVFTRRAENDLRAIFRAIAKHNLPAAERTVRDLLQRIELLRTFPELGQERPDIRRGSRALVQRPFLILYDVSPRNGIASGSEVRIVAVVDSRRDLSELV